MNRPHIRSIPAAFDEDIPEIIAISYDLWRLRITLLFERAKAPVYVDFDKVRGYRVLDEGDLNEFWAPGVRANGWLCEVHCGGWFDLEQSRSGFIMPADSGVREFLVAGINDCVSVLSHVDPIITQLEP